MTNSWKSKAITYLYYTLFFIIPFIVLPITSELFEFNKMIVIYTIAAFIFCIWLLDSFSQEKLLWVKTPFDIPLILFWFSQLMSTLFSIDIHTSLFGYYGRFNGGLLSITVYIYLYYMFAYYIAPQPSHFRKVAYITSLSSLLVVLWGMPGVAHHDLSCLIFTGRFDNTCWTDQFRPAERMFSTLGQPNWLGAYLSISFLITCYLFFTSHKKMSLYLVGVLLLQWVGLLYTRSRSSLFSLVPGFALFGFAMLMYRSKMQAFFAQKKYPLVMVCALGLTALFLIRTGIPQIDRILSLQFLQKLPVRTQEITTPNSYSTAPLINSEVTESFDIRKIVWTGALRLAAEYPLFGTGLETFGYAYYQVRPASHNLTSEWDYLYNRAHNEFLNVLATSGWVGFSAYMVLIVWIVAILAYKGIQARSDFQLILLPITFISVLFSIIITNFFGFSISVINLYWYLLPAMALTQLPKGSVLQNKTKISLFQVGFVIFVGLILINYISTYWYADYLYAQADGAIKSENIEAGERLLTNALNLRYEHVYQDKLSYALAQLAFVKIYNKQTDIAQEMLTRSENLNEQSIKASPKNVLYWKTRVKNQYIYYQMTLDKKFLFTGLSALEEAGKLAPTDPKIPYFASTYYTLLYDEEKNTVQKTMYESKSLESINHAIQLKKNYFDAYMLKIQLLKKYKRYAELKDLAKWYLEHVDPQNEDMKKEYTAL